MFVAAQGALAATTEVTITRFANDGVTVLAQETVDITWMEANLPVYGDGTTHYYFQGPSFDFDNLWDTTETVNVLSRDYGAVKGSDVRDLCDLVGGMNEGEWVDIKADDNFVKSFDYDDVYTPDPGDMRMVLAWYNGEESITGEHQGVGYPPDYYTGMRLFFFDTDTSENPYDLPVFGTWDMHENLAEDRWHYYYDGNDFWPSSSGLSVKWVDRILIYSDDAPTGSVAVSSSPGEARVLIDGDDSGYETNCTIPDLEEGMYSISVEKEGYEDPGEQDVEVEFNEVAEVHFDLVPLKGSLTIASEPSGASIFLDGEDTGMETDTTIEEITGGEHTIVLRKEGYEDAAESVMVVGEQDTGVFIELIPAAGGSEDEEGGDGKSTSGYTGKSLSQFLSGSLNGTVAVYRSTGDAVSLNEDDIAAYTLPVAVPANTTPSLGRLYLYATEGRGASEKGLKPSFSVRFNGEEIYPERSYSDIMGSTYAGSIAATWCYEVTSLLGDSGDYTVDVTCEGPDGIECLVYGAVLVGVFEGESLPSLTYWIDEGCDVIFSDPDEGTTPEDCISSAPFEGDIDPATVTNATLTLICTGPGDGGDASHAVAMNDWEWVNPLAGSGEGIVAFMQDARPHLVQSGNVATVQSNGPRGPLLEHRSAILVAEHLSVIRETEGGEGEATPAATPSPDDGGGMPAGSGTTYALAGTGPAGNCTHLLLSAGNFTLYIPNDAVIVDGEENPVVQCTMKQCSPGSNTSSLTVVIEPEDAGSDTPLILAASLPQGLDAPSGQQQMVFARRNVSTGEWDLLTTFTDPVSGTLYCQISRFGEYALRAQVPSDSPAPGSPTLFQSFITLLMDILQVLFGPQETGDQPLSPPFALPREEFTCALQEISPVSAEITPPAAEGPFALTIRSFPPGALIELNGTYTGRTTPTTFAPFPTGSYAMRLVLDGFAPSEQQFQLDGDLVLYSELVASGNSALSKLKFGTLSDWPDRCETGGVYVSSEPDGAAIYVDGRESVFKTPHVVSGLKEGTHTIRVKMAGTSFAADSRKVWVYPGSLTSCSFDATESPIAREITVVSDTFEGAPFTVDGGFRSYSIPEQLTIDGNSPVVNVLDGERFLSFSFLGINDGSTLRVEPDDAPLAGVTVESDPPGAEIFIDGFRTGFCTPYLIENVTEGYHHVALSRPGFIPAGEKIYVIDSRLAESDAIVRLHLDSFPYGSLNITSSPPGAKIYLYNRYTGLTTPHTFTYMGIGSYTVRVLSDEVSAERDNVLVQPYTVSRCHFDLVTG